MRRTIVGILIAGTATFIGNPPGAAALPLQAKVASGAWSDGTTTGTSRTVVMESCDLEYVCTITADADTHVGAAATHGVCTDTMASVGTRSIASPFCRAVFRIVGLETGGPEACDATTLTSEPKGTLTYTTSDGLNSTVLGIDITIVNGVAKVQGEVVAASGRLLGYVSATFPARCETSTHYGGWSGTYDYTI